MATITRDNLFRALEEASEEFVPRGDKQKLYKWAFDVSEFVVGDWDKCPLDQAGLVQEFRTRSRYDEAENVRFQNEASEVDARILNYVKTDLVGELRTGLLVYVS